MSDTNKTNNKKPQQLPAPARNTFRPGMARGGGGGPMALMPGEKAKNFKASMKQLLAYLGKYRLLIVLVLLIAAASTVFSIFGPRILGQATTALYEGVVRTMRGDARGIDMQEIAAILSRVALFYLFSSVLSLIQGFFMVGVTADITYRMRKEISTKINRLPLSFFDTITQGEVLSRVSIDVDTISQTLNQSLSQIITSLTSVVGILFMMLSINLTMTLIALTFVPLSILIIRLVISKSQTHFKQQQVYLGHINGHVEEMYGGHVVLKAFNGEQASTEKFDGLNKTLYTSAWKSQLLSHLIMPVMRFIGNLGFVAVAVLGGSLVIKKQLTLGDIQAFIQYMRGFQQPLMDIANISNILQQTAAAAERVFEFLNETEESPDPAEPAEITEVRGAVEFRHVHFGYDPENIIIRDFSVKVEPGQHIAIVGPTGAGKTTLMKLLMRFYELNGGEILVDDINITHFRREDLRDIFSMVLQDTWLFNGTIMENIRYGNTEASEDQVILAADTAYTDHFIRTLPGGYQMVLNEEASNVSAGQKQLLTIARAVLSDPAILILDEATSSVDTRTEVLIQKAMDKLLHGRTSFIIAHRLSTIKNADRILVVRDGDIVEQGTHEELLARNGFYADLYNSQFALQTSF